MAQLQVLVEPIFSTLPPGLESWLRLLLSQQVSRWKEKGRNAVGLRDEAVAARPPPPRLPPTAPALDFLLVPGQRPQVSGRRTGRQASKFRVGTRCQSITQRRPGL